MRCLRGRYMFLGCLTWGICIPSSAGICNSDPVAVADEATYLGSPTVIVDVLANDSEPDGEALTVGSLSTTCAGSLAEGFGLVTLTVTGPFSDCTISYQITDESGNSASGTVTVRDGTTIFLDGFESGDLSRWSIGKQAS